MTRWKRGGGLVALCISYTIFNSTPAAADGDPVVVDGTATEISCAGSTCGEPNTYNPGFQGCVMSFGSSVATPGPDSILPVIRPPRSRVRITLTPTSGWDPALYVTTSDSADSIAADAAFCLAGADNGFNGASEVITRLDNDTDAPDTVYVIVDSALSSGSLSCGDYVLDFEFAPILGDACGDDIFVTLAAAETRSLVGYTCANQNNIAPSSCSGLPMDGTPGRDATFAVTVEPTGSWTLRLTPDSDWDASLVVSIACDDATKDCIRVGESGGVGAVETLDLFVLEEDTTFYVTVDSPVPAGSIDGCGGWSIELSTPDDTPIETLGWSELKHRFR